MEGGVVLGRDYSKCKDKSRNMLAVLGIQTGVLRAWTGLEYPEGREARQR